MNDILCYKCQNLLDNPIQCNECHINYCNDCIVDENKNKKTCLICKKNNLKKIQIYFKH